MYRWHKSGGGVTHLVNDNVTACGLVMLSEPVGPVGPIYCPRCEEWWETRRVFSEDALLRLEKDLREA